MNFERVVSSSLSKLDSEKNENEEMGQRQTTEVIGSDFRDSLLLLLLMQQLTIVWEIVLVPGCLLNKWKGTGGRESESTGGRESESTGGGRGRGAGEQGTGSGSRSKEGDTKFLVYYWVSFSQKHLPSKVLKFLFNIHQCLKENFESKKT